VLTISIVGDAMARPLADEIEASGAKLPSLFAVSSTGALLSGAIRERLARLLPGKAILDNFGSTESGYTASGVAGGGARYRPNDAALIILDDDLVPVPPGSGRIGQLARRGRVSFGYYNDPDKSEAAFAEVDGERWLLTGDLATAADDGTITIFGRGSACINTGGEKVFAEEVEAVLKAHPAVFDVIVTSVPDQTYGQRVTAVIQVDPAAAPSSPADLDRHCRATLAGYKVPRGYIFVDEVVRSPAGKPDYGWAREVAARSAT
jgi:acyl-CoA synthetase (AMP-forming)/AMP-acid ligase II